MDAEREINRRKDQKGDARKGENRHADPRQGEDAVNNARYGLQRMDSEGATVAPPQYLRQMYTRRRLNRLALAGPGLVRCGLAAAGLAVGALTSCTSAKEQADPDTAAEGRSFPTSREAWRWPFTPGSAWNMPTGSGLTAADGSDACALGLRDDAVDAWVNAEEWSHPILRAEEGDPVLSVSEEGVVIGQVQTPDDAQPAQPQYPDGDAHLHLVDPAGGTVTEMWKARAQDGGWEVDSLAVVDLYSSGIGTDGVRIYGGSAIGGLIRMGEVDTGIWHALALALPVAVLEPRFVWPATTLDTSREDDMVGHVPVGQLVLLPAGTDEGIARTAAGRALVRALRDYGAYVVDHSSNFALYAEPLAEPEVAPGRDDLDAIRARLVCATNNTQEEPGGPGDRAQSFAPELE